jgi:ABC-type antimicrobial peptide transport system permease subunit
MASVGRLVGVGAGIGLGLTWLAGRVLQSLLFGVSPMDLAALAGAILALVMVAAVAALAPARRAARIDPLAAIRE